MNIRILIRVRPLHYYHRYWIYTDASLSLGAFSLITYLLIFVPPMTIEKNIRNYMDYIENKIVLFRKVLLSLLICLWDRIGILEVIFSHQQ